MFLIVFPYRDQILQYIAHLRDNKFKYIWSQDLHGATETLDRAKSEPVKTVYIYPGFETVVQFLEGSRFIGAEIIWLIQPEEVISLPIIPGKEIRCVDTRANLMGL